MYASQHSPELLASAPCSGTRSLHTSAGEHSLQTLTLQVGRRDQLVAKVGKELQTLRYSVNEVPCHVELTQCQLVMVTVIQHIQEISIERMNIINLWEVFQYLQGVWTISFAASMQEPQCMSWGCPTP